MRCEGMVTDATRRSLSEDLDCGEFPRALRAVLLLARSYSRFTFAMHLLNGPSWKENSSGRGKEGARREGRRGGIRIVPRYPR